MTSLKRVLLGGAVAACLAAPLVTPAPAQAWWAHPGWHAGWGWHAGFGWRGGVFVGVPRVVVGPPVVYAPPAYGYRWIPGYYTPAGVYVAPHWGYY
jgi:hypothetical protein